jgi:Tfp pilus assembly protein PilF
MKFLIIVAIALALVACGSDEPAEREPTVGKEVADEYNRQLDEARAVQDQVMQQKQKIDEALQEAENN